MQLSGASSAAGERQGGIIYNAGICLKIFDSTLQGSTAEASGAGNDARGAAIYASGQLTFNVRRSDVRGNTASAVPTARRARGRHLREQRRGPR